LNSVGRFFESASVSVVLNLVMAVATLISLWLGYKREPEAGIIQAWAVFVAGFLQLALLMWGMHKAGMRLGFRWPRMTDDMRRLVKLGIPGVISGGVTQINIAIGTVIASLQPGAVSQLYYADRVYELPLSIVGIAVGVVLLPDVARQLRAGDTAGVMDSQNRSLEFAMLLTVPATLALAVIPHDIVRVLFERGAFHPEDTANTASLLAMFALGLPSFVMIKVFSPIYFAREDTKTPMRYAVISLTANTIGSIVLFFVLRELGMMPQLGIAIGTVIASLQPGAVSQLYYADRVYELPLSIVGIAVGVVLLPDVARQLRAGDTAGVMDSQNRSLEFAMLLTVPATLALAVIPHDIVRVLFERGAFHPEDTANTASLLAMFALGLPSFVMIKVFSPIYFAREDTKTPMRYAVISLTANTIGSIVLFFVLRELGMMPQLGIAIATTLGGWLNAYLLWAKLRKHDDFIADARLRRNVPLIIVASVAMVGALLATSYVLAPYLGAEARFVEKTAALAVEIGVGVSVFGLFILAFGVMSLRQLGTFVRRRGKA